MPSKRFLGFLQLWLVVVATVTAFGCGGGCPSCGSGVESVARQPAAGRSEGSEGARSKERSADDSRGSSAEGAESLPNEVRTRAMEPQVHRITVDDLPAPYATDSARKSPEVVERPDDAALSVPAGFRVQIVAEELDEPRWLALTPEGHVLVTETRDNRITRLVDGDNDGVAEKRSVFATEDNGLDIPFGMAFAGGKFFLGNHDGVLSFDYEEGQDRLQGRGRQIAELPGGGYRQHWTRNVVVAPDGKRLFVSIGSRSNADVEPLPRASIQVMNLDGSDMRTFASGLRNPVGLDFHPETRELYAAVNERDELGDDLVPDYFTRVREGDFYGWPFAYITPEKLDPRHVDNGKSKRPDLVATTKTPDVLFRSHSAALGLAFYDRAAFPPRYRGGAFVAFRGSWNRDRGTGYKLVFVPFRDGRPVGHYEDFVTGFLLDPAGPTTWGRPVGVLVLPDGSLVFTDEPGGRVFRVSYAG